MLNKPMVNRDTGSTPKLRRTGIVKKARIAAISIPTSTLPITLFTCLRVKRRLKVPQKTSSDVKVKGRISVNPK